MKTEKVKISLIDANEYAKGNYTRKNADHEKGNTSDLATITVNQVSQPPQEVEKEIASWASIKYSKTIYSQQEPEITRKHFMNHYKTDFQIAGLIGVAAALPKLLPQKTLKKLKKGSTVEITQKHNIIQKIENCQYYFTKEPFIHRIKTNRTNFYPEETKYSRGHQLKIRVYKK